MRIAVYLDAASTLVSLYEPGTIHLYDDASGSWQDTQTVAFAFRPGMSILETKVAIKHMAAQLRDCRVLLSGDLRGMVYSVLQEELGYHTWKSEGSLLEQLATVADKEVGYAAELAAAAAAEAAAPKVPISGCGGGGGGRGGGPQKHKLPAPQAELIEQGHYRIDLAQVMARDPNLNSRLALIPIMESTPFQKLEILCDHLPRWFEQKLTALHLRAEVEHLGSGVRALVFRHG